MNGEVNFSTTSTISKWRVVTRWLSSAVIMPLASVTLQIELHIQFDEYQNLGCIIIFSLIDRGPAGSLHVAISNVRGGWVRWTD